MLGDLNVEPNGVPSNIKHELHVLVDGCEHRTPKSTVRANVGGRRIPNGVERAAHVLNCSQPMEKSSERFLATCSQWKLGDRNRPQGSGNATFLSNEPSSVQLMLKSIKKKRHCSSSTSCCHWLMRVRTISRYVPSGNSTGERKSNPFHLMMMLI